MFLYFLIHEVFYICCSIYCIFIVHWSTAHTVYIRELFSVHRWIHFFDLSFLKLFICLVFIYSIYLLICLFINLFYLFNYLFNYLFFLLFIYSSTYQFINITFINHRYSDYCRSDCVASDIRKILFRKIYLYASLFLGKFLCVSIS